MNNIFITFIDVSFVKIAKFIVNNISLTPKVIKKIYILVEQF